MFWVCNKVFDYNRTELVSKITNFEIVIGVKIVASLVMIPCSLMGRLGQGNFLMFRLKVLLNLSSCGSTVLVGLGRFFSFLICTQSVEHHGRGISPSQAGFMHTEQHRHGINADIIHASIEIGIHDPSGRAREDSWSLRERGRGALCSSLPFKEAYRIKRRNEVNIKKQVISVHRRQTSHSKFAILFKRLSFRNLKISHAAMLVTMSFLTYKLL
jgi:hypothetical protein